jgi:hypothetical protein
MIVSDLMRFSLGVCYRVLAGYEVYQSDYLIGICSAQLSRVADESSFEKNE